MFNTELLENETEQEYIWRLGQAKDCGELTLTWDRIAALINKCFHADENSYRTESTYRKQYVKEKKIRTGNTEKVLGKPKVNNELIEFEKAKVKLSDARIEYNRLIRQEARKESYAEMVKRIICENVEPINIPVHYTLFNSTTDLLCHLTDIHTGIDICNWKNTFNQDILKKRIETYTSHILDIRGLHQSQDCYLVIGEVVSGIIHNNLRLQNNLNLMEQFKLISELISAMLARLSNHFNHVYVYVTPGNHSRISPKKEDSLDGENMDLLLPFYLKARMQNFTNISICENRIDDEIAMFSIRGNTVFATHGHKDSPANVVQNFTMMYDIKPAIVLLGHRHTNSLTTVYDTKVIQSGCVSGTDNYALSLRKTNRPEQTVSVVGDNGLICLYDIGLD